jgi:hypothetical protein
VMNISFGRSEGSCHLFLHQDLELQSQLLLVGVAPRSKRNIALRLLAFRLLRCASVSLSGVR